MDISLDILREEQSFIEACKAREEWALKLLYETYYPRLMPVCLRYACDQEEAKDLLHEGFIKAFRYIQKYQAGTSLDAWMRRLIVNSCIDHYRKKKKYRTTDIEEVYDMNHPDPSILDDLNAQEIMRGLQKLPPSYRSVFNLYVIEGYTHKEIADKLGVSESTSRSNLVKARKKLQSILSKWCGNE